MKNVAIINVCSNFSTGKIARCIQRGLEQEGFNTLFCYGRGPTLNNENCYRIDYHREILVHAILCRITGLEGVYSEAATKRLLKVLESKNIDTIIVLNLHAYYINTPLLYQYVKNRCIRLINLMVDESAYVGKCGGKGDCQQYLNGCSKCPRYRVYPRSLFFDRASALYKVKQQNYHELNNAVFIGPEFIAKSAKKSPLMKDLIIETLDEPIDADFYRPTDTSALKEKLSIDDNKIIIMCVMPKRKSGDYFYKLALSMQKYENFMFIHVAADTKGVKRPLNNLIEHGYVETLETLMAFYTLGDLFVFTSMQDAQPNACIEAMLCGTPLLCFDISGMPYLADEKHMRLVTPGSVDDMRAEVLKTNKKTKEISDSCRDYAYNRYDSKMYVKKLLSIINKTIGI